MRLVAGEGHALGLLVGVLLIAAIAGLAIGFGVLTGAFSRGPAEVVYGTVLTVNVSASDSGPSMRARVRTADGERTLELPPRSVCWPGDRIELWKRGTRYGPGLGGCTRP
jgi:hypothetical protein